jgi:hypothetical protein
MSELQSVLTRIWRSTSVNLRRSGTAAEGRVYGERHRNLVGRRFWTRGFLANTVGRDEEAIRTYTRKQEGEDQRLEQLNLWRCPATLGGPNSRDRVSHPPTGLSGSSQKALGFAGDNC